jgi:hypothetical protein
LPFPSTSFKTSQKNLKVKFLVKPSKNWRKEKPEK